ncbi:MAG: hypothetical protein Kow0040_32650 [Thermogutta sp.]
MIVPQRIQPPVPPPPPKPETSPQSSDLIRALRFIVAAVAVTFSGTAFLFCFFMLWRAAPGASLFNAGISGPYAAGAIVSGLGFFFFADRAIRYFGP